MAKEVRYTIDLTEDLNQEIEEIAEKAGITKSELFRRALALLKVTQRATDEGEHVGVVKDRESLKREFVLG